MSQETSWLVIVNPHSGGSDKWPLMKEEMEKQRIDFTYVLTNYKEDVTHEVYKALQNGCFKFIAVGGDGSSNILINAMMMHQELATEPLVFANLTCGTGNDWQRGRGWPKSIHAQVAAIKQLSLTWMDLGIVIYPNGERRYFHNMLGLAYDAYVVHKMSNLEKKKIGPLIYILSVVRYIFQFDIPTLRIVINNRIIEKEMYTFNIGLGTHAGSGMQICPHAKDRKDGFAVLIAYKMSKLRVLMESIRFYTGSIHTSSKTEALFSKHISASSSTDPMQVEADGEIFAPGPIEVKIYNKALQTVVFNKIL